MIKSVKICGCAKMGQLNQTFNPGVIEVVVGTMYSGKSKELIERGRRAQTYGDVETYFFKPALDTRDFQISSRNGMKAEAHLIDKGKEVLEIMKDVEDPSMILIDEAQFLDDSILYAIQLLKKENHNIILAGLDKDFRGQAFGVMPSIMALSEYSIRKVYPVCAIEGCWEDGTLPQRLRNGEPDSALSKTVVIEGSNDNITYRPVCMGHHEVPDLEQYLEQKLNETS